ncbi:MAG: hypothetical protein PCALPYG88_1900 [uncultured Paraburkholderia sp.]|uniref:hypothetical protein n=1 Tax=uncultured Paraburkholderia sp. TaxID=1822466 RepID=UPI0025933410|nr:hypothetical protein [uncultured Paraburkholderia sp.]CAH2917807.1 MAG: hypothetical protein PCALPYG88_1900 [uncultured Paraburkholderia sp.]
MIFDRERYRYQQYLSDIAGQDISAHSDSHLNVINKVRAWLNGSRPKDSSPLIGPKKIANLYEQFKKDLPAICAKASLDHADLDFNDLLYFSGEWIVSSA